MWGVPFGVGLALFAPDIVQFGIGNRWRPALGLIQVFGLIAAADQIGFNWDAYFRARADTKPIAAVSVLNMIVFCTVTVPLLVSHGLDGFALGMAILTVISICARGFFLRRLFRGLGMLRHGARAIAPTVPAVAGVLAIRAAESGGRSAAFVAVEASAYLLLTGLATFALERALLREMLGYLGGTPGAQQQPS
jgi:O-antigen/teichoic acid export membrane protein